MKNIIVRFLLAVPLLYSSAAAWAQNGGIPTAVNISARAKVNLGEGVLVGGFILQGVTPAVRVLIRALGPELSARGLTNVLPDTVLELRDGNGGLIAFNDDWEVNQEAVIFFSDQAPMNPRESAVVETLTPGSYTVVVRGKNDTVGIALLEVYLLP